MLLFCPPIHDNTFQYISIRGQYFHACIYCINMYWVCQYKQKTCKYQSIHVQYTHDGAIFCGRQPPHIGMYLFGHEIDANTSQYKSIQTNTGWLGTSLPLVPVGDTGTIPFSMASKQLACFPEGTCDRANAPGSGSKLFYINTWAMVWPSDHPVSSEWSVENKHTLLLWWLQILLESIHIYISFGIIDSKKQSSCS